MCQGKRDRMGTGGVDHQGEREPDRRLLAAAEPRGHPIEEALQGEEERLEQAEIERARRKPIASLDAYDYYLRGISALHRWEQQANADAARLVPVSLRKFPPFRGANLKMFEEARITPNIISLKDVIPRLSGTPGLTWSDGDNPVATMRWKEDLGTIVGPFKPAAGSTVPMS